ncbi:MAG TPA: gamma-glutamyl-gamma-aminobutyrate hydrolase family protein [Mariprofundaceae bacterium]|nr:gamma-glutamyl-gamma-aminobutyrate hydrolase family protein [Mariprofundaceae bacterium]
MKERRKVAIISSSPDVVRLFRRYGWSVVHNIADADLVQLTGGADVHPRLYGEPPLPNNSWVNEDRDAREVLVIKQALKMGKPLAGICRGGQLLNVLFGGGMWQDIDGHMGAGTHEAWDTRTGETFQVTSTHHQMMRPPEGAETIIVSRVSTKKQRMSKVGRPPMMVFDTETPDIEAVWFPAQRAWCFQPHPEYAGFEGLSRRYFEYIEDFIFNNEREVELTAGE